MYVGVKQLESRRVDGRMTLDMPIYEGRIVSTLRHHISLQHISTLMYTCIYIYIYIPVLRTRHDRLLAAAYIAFLDKQFQHVFAIECHHPGAFCYYGLTPELLKPVFLRLCSPYIIFLLNTMNMSNNTSCFLHPSVTPFMHPLCSIYLFFSAVYLSL